MCGICGFTGKGSSLILKKMSDSLLHRGPDEEGSYTDEKISLGIRRLSIIDVNTGHQPIHNEDKSVWMVFNGEVYNFKELRNELENRGHKFYTDHSDSEVIVHLYEEFGEGFLAKINGMFAIALWDKKNSKLILARDRMGVKPLFYALVCSRLIFASEIKTILENPNYCRKINYEAIYHYFTLKNIPAPLTAFRGLNSLLPGEILVFSDGKVSKRRWWRIEFKEKHDYDTSFIKERILSLLEDATRIRMISDVPLGAYLSGGVDSSSIVALMSKFSTNRLKTFSLGYEDELKNKEADLYYARKVSKVYNTEHFEYIMSYKELINDIENIISAFDQPFSGTISTYFLSKLLKKHVKVALSGDGADELFGSYMSHRVSQPMHCFAKMRDKIKAGSITKEEEKLFAPFGLNYLENLFEESGGSQVKWRYRLYLFSDDEKQNLLSRRFKEKIRRVTSLQLINSYFSNLTSGDILNRILEMEWNTQFPDQVLAFVDFLSMAYSIEIRSPFLDYRLVGFAATIPGNLKINCGNVKDIFKKSVESLLPEGITKRPKEGFVLPIYDWMSAKLQSYCLDVLSDNRLKKHGLLNSETVSGILNEYYSGNRANAGKIWNLMMFQIWWEKYFG